ncbi:MAG TPA: hypothetical protein VIE15_05945 [Acidimicrobiales bacterium]|jgi:hypothetical protein
MRKVLALVIAAAAIAVGAGLALPADAVKVGASSLSSTELDSELAAIDASPSYQCYLQAQAFVNSSGASSIPVFAGVSARSWSNAASADWTYERAKQLAAIQYVGVRNPAAFSPASLNAAEVSLASEITRVVSEAFQASSQTTPFTCTKAQQGFQTLASLPTWFVDEQVHAQAATLGLEPLLSQVIPESGPGLKAWFDLNASQFDTSCLSLILVRDLHTASVVQAKISAGLALSDAVARYSLDPQSRAVHGAIGCFSPTSSLWPSIWSSINPLKIGQVAIFPSNGQYVLVGPTKRTPNQFAAIAAAVAHQAHQLNGERAGALALQIQASTVVRVDPAIGTWVPTALGGTIQPPASPPPGSMPNATANLP